MSLLTLKHSLELILEHMYKFQRKHNVKNQCIANTCYLRDQLKELGFHPKAKAVLHTSFNNNALYICHGHLVLEIEGLGKDKFVDPSYEYAHLEQQQYFEDITTLLKAVPHLKDQKEMLQQVIKGFLYFVKTAEDINNNDCCLVADEDIYTKQALYVQEQIDRSFS
jgi:hypothetical protein